MRLSQMPFVRSILAGGLPLVAGAAVYELWRSTRWDALLFVGALVIALGVISTLFGTAALVRERSQVKRWDGRSRLLHALAIVLMVGCYPVAGWLTLRAMEIHTSFVVEVRNASRIAMTSCRLVATEIDVEVGPLAPGAHVKELLVIQADGTLRCIATAADGTRHRMLVAGYVTPNLGGDARITFDENGDPRIESR